MATEKLKQGSNRQPPPKDKQFKKGQSGNPNGRPKKLPKLEEVIENVLGEVNSKGESVPEVILRRLIVSAKNGSIKAAELILDRAYGKVKQGVELSGDITLNKVEFVKGGDKD
jgi:hypothetical protein